MDSYSKLELEKTDDIYANEFVLPILTSTIPDKLIEYSELDCKSYIEEKLKQNYKLLLMVPSFPRVKILRNANILENTNIFTLYMIDSITYDDSIWDFLNENEFANGHDFFLVKKTNGVNFAIPSSSKVRIKISNLTSNTIVVLRLEMNEVIELQWH
ncbi:hypothetical protein FQ087_15275 [Sporosarcina sp. ANT_H38]|uniref:hypothetical protein n=1 Tax=Sporosarcina sp. ANT_H38 TaxID=2597358 RepID=UPI0011F20A41|nr:hypothetical protein [Sporosarcina sp. ANT_H38]KAA0955935.1 hypothetical protein FQ087_15275 [Sporosarcina sp. ANT_H38]